MAQRRQVTIGGRRVSYLTAGDGPAVVLLHGIGGNAIQWNAQLDSLSDEFRVIAWDTPGYGESDDPAGDWRMSDYAEVLAGVLAALDLGGVHLIGQSWGGVLAQEFYRSHAGRVRSLVLSDTFPGDACRPQPERDAGLQGRLRALETMTPAEMATARLPMLVPEETSDEVKREIESMLAMIHPSGYRRAAIALHDSDERDVLPTVTVPTLVIAGEHDRVVPLDLSRMLSDGIHAARLEIIPGAGHLSNQEKPEVYNDLLREFLGSIQEKAM